MVTLRVGRERLNSAVRSRATSFASMCFINNDGVFTAALLPAIAQISPIRGIVVDDIDRDGRRDLFIAGDLYGTEVETTRYDAGMGLLLKGTGACAFTPLSGIRSGVSVQADTRHLAQLRVRGRPCILVVNNSDRPRLYTLRRSAPEAPDNAL